MKVKELISVMAMQTMKENSTMHVVLGFEDDEEYFSTWLPEFLDLNQPEYSERLIRSMWFSSECNTLCISVSGGIKWENGYVHIVNVTADSGISMIKDIIARLKILFHTVKIT